MSESSQRSSRLGHPLAWLLGIVLLSSAVAKVLSLGGFELYLVEQHLLPSRESAAYAARLLLAVELFLGAACFLRAGFRRVTLPLIFGMLTVFTLYLAYAAFVRKETGSCHCFGDLLPMSPKESIVKNLALLALAAYLARKTRGWPAGTWRAPAGLALASLLVVFLALPVRPVPVLPAGKTPPPSESRFSGFRQFSNGLTANLTTGTCLVAFLSLDCEHCASLAARLGEDARQQRLPPLYAIFLGKPQEAPGFLKTANAEFPYLCAEPRVFYDFIGKRPPRVYLLQEGAARRFWDEETFDADQLALQLLNDAPPLEPPAQ